MSGKVQPLDPDVALLVDAAKELDLPSPETSARVLARVTARVAATPPGGSRGSHGGGGPVAASAPSLRWLRGRSVLMAAAWFGLGVAVGVGVRRSTAPRERIVYVDRTVPLVTRTEGAAAASAVSVESLPRVSPPPLESSSVAGDSPHPPAAAASPRDQLSAESALLDLARVAVAQGDGDRALEAVERHGAQFPNGLLAEEREALTVKSLHLLGRNVEARARAARFERVYPKSLFLPALRGVLEPPP